MNFPTTPWTVVLNAGCENSAAAAAALEQVCRAYWYPLYAFARRRGHDSHAAEDLTQSFFARLFENDGLKSLDRKKGKFRSFMLKTTSSTSNARSLCPGF